jgi:hypothetical protein
MERMLFNMLDFLLGYPKGDSHSLSSFSNLLTHFLLQKYLVLLNLDEEIMQLQLWSPHGFLQM